MWKKINLGMLAYDIADLFERNEYPVEVGVDAIRAALPDFLERLCGDGNE